MTPEILTFAEAATRKAHQLNMLGTFNTLVVPAVPVLLAAMVVGQVRFRTNESGKHNINFSLMDADGSERWANSPVEFEVAFKYASNETVSYTALVPIICELYEGNHDLRLLVDGQEVLSTPLGVSVREQK